MKQGNAVLLFLRLLFLSSFFLYLFGLVFYLFESLDNVLDVGLVGIILDGDSLGLEIRDDPCSACRSDAH